MKTSEILGTLLGIFLMVGVWHGFSLAITLAYIIMAIFAVLMLLGLLAVPHMSTVDLIKIKDGLTLNKFIVSWLMIAAWVYVLLHTNNIDLLYAYVGYQIIAYTFIIRLFTKQEEN